MLTVDLKTVMVPNSRRVWRLFPGEGYKFLQSFLESGSAFLDLPTMELPPGKLFPNRDLLQRMIAANETAGRIRKDRHNANPAHPDEFKDARTSNARGRRRQAIVNFYSEAGNRDIVIMPSTLEVGRVFVGEFTSDAAERSRELVPSKYFNFSIPSRKVRWLTEIDEQKLSGPLSRSLRNQHPFSLVERSFFPEIFSIAYNNFCFGELFSSVILNLNDDFIDKDAALLTLASRLSAIFTERVLEHSTDWAIDDYFSLILSEGHEDYASQIATDIHSAGFSRYVASKPTPLVLMTLLSILMTLAPLPAGDISAELAQPIQVVNSLSPDDIECTPPVSKATEMILRSAGERRIIEMCRAMHDANRRSGLKPHIETTRTPMPAQRTD